MLLVAACYRLKLGLVIMAFCEGIVLPGIGDSYVKWVGMFTLHENLTLTNFDSYQKCIKVGRLSLTHESKMLDYF